MYLLMVPMLNVPYYGAHVEYMYLTMVNMLNVPYYGANVAL